MQLKQNKIRRVSAAKYLTIYYSFIVSFLPRSSWQHSLFSLPCLILMQPSEAGEAKSPYDSPRSHHPLSFMANGDGLERRLHPHRGKEDPLSSCFFLWFIFDYPSPWCNFSLGIGRRNSKEN